ncbi:hypothetical protein N0392_20175 [Morganella morganii]|uniref:Uncharacterized protein n=1 Tax=Morganella morganii TaxID=582 RepID=A0A9Q4GTG5_MORMO|nr:hypothetical protein [Morganella morganii]MCY0791981.1 hypothetical protein [Morganella morganii]
MARRSELKGIAIAINGSFVSRNNDFNGYWSIGQIKSFALYNGLTSVTFPLTLPMTNSVSNLQNYMVNRYAKMLNTLLTKQKLPSLWVSNAVIKIDFNANVEYAKLYENTTSGEPFQCTCKITDDNDRDYSSIMYGRCLPHSVVRELKSTRNSPSV